MVKPNEITEMRVALVGRHDIIVSIPAELVPFAADLQYFVQTMVRKLHINRHKGFAENTPVNGLLGLLHDEVLELENALGAESQFEAAIEAADVSNMAFLMALKIWQMSKQEYKDMQNGNT